MADTPTTQTRPLAENFTSKPTAFDKALTYYADGTKVSRRGKVGLVGTTAGMTVDAIPYQFQVVKWDDGTQTNTAPHVLEPVQERQDA